MFIVEGLLVYILHGYGSCHQSLFGCDLVEGSRELFIADDILLVYMALIVRVASVVLSWEWDGSSTVVLVVRVALASTSLLSTSWLLSSESESLQTSLLVYMALVVGVSSVVLWWNGASRLVYMALVVRISPVLLLWKRDGSSTWLLLSESLQLQLCFGGCGTARHLWQYVELHAPL
eukprot:scaffold2276_cov79-Skeletonema_dohrnii-CCMP3373.AAC.1